ncbi:MAG: DUF349 domain-containing protein [Bacteroidetes bacterium CG_4_8_14_3_um_filter_31_14]|nr:MAG: DUF349 domain-containing protein [Bacteroidetes bacterium CG_4_8_14_3_um_filter_31_14]
MEQNELEQSSTGDFSTENNSIESNTESKSLENNDTEETSKNLTSRIFDLQSENKADKDIVGSTLSDNIKNEIQNIDNEDNYIDYSSLTKLELIQKFKQILSEKKITYLRNEIENIKVNFYKKNKAENEELRKKFIEKGGDLEKYIQEPDKVEEEFKQLYKDYRERRNELTKTIEEQKIANYKIKQEIIASIKELINKPELLQHTIEDFHNLQDKWRTIGIVPQNEMKTLYDSYHFTVQEFYNWLKLNKEAREIDFRRNLDSKIELCEKVESLIIEKDVRKAFNELQILHERWREIGPVSPDKKDEIWQRLHEATTQIHKNHQEYYLKKKEEYEGNLNAKTILCEKAEEISSKVYNRYKEWENGTNDFIELQQVWKTIGMVPKSENTKIFKRFKDASDSFFAAKKEFYKLIMEEENNNLQIKTDICLKAESLKDSNDWKRTTNEFIQLQKEWRRIGPVSRKFSDKIWNRFRVACNEFFENKNKHFSTIDGLLNENLKKKEQLIENINNYTYTENCEEDLNNLKQFQKEWVEIGLVPENKRSIIQEKYKKTINNAFNSLKVDDKKKENIKFKMRIENIMQQQDSHDKLYFERETLTKKLNQIETELKTLENNIGFFSKSKKSESLLKDFTLKIEDGKKESSIIKEHIKYLDNIIKN